jgi:hypothetical protein
VENTFYIDKAGCVATVIDGKVQNISIAVTSSFVANDNSQNDYVPNVGALKRYINENNENFYTKSEIDAKIGNIESLLAEI